MLTPEKDELLAELLGGRESEAYKVATAQATKADETAQAAGVSFKEIVQTATALSPGLSVADAEARFKAFFLDLVTTKAPMPAAEMVDAGMTEMEDGAAEMEDEGGDNLLSPGEIDAIATAVAEKLMGAIDGIAARLGEVDNELKGRGYQRMKEAPDALDAVKASLATIEATVKELAGLAPERSYKASRDNDDLPAEIAAMLKGEMGSTDPYADVMKFLNPAS